MIAELKNFSWYNVIQQIKKPSPNASLSVFQVPDQVPDCCCCCWQPVNISMAKYERYGTCMCSSCRSTLEGWKYFKWKLSFITKTELCQLQTWWEFQDDGSKSAIVVLETSIHKATMAGWQNLNYQHFISIFGCCLNKFKRRMVTNWDFKCHLTLLNCSCSKSMVC